MEPRALSRAALTLRTACAFKAEDALKGINTRAFMRVNALPMPVIAVLEGYALGGGAELAYAADIRVGTPTLKIATPRQASASSLRPGRAGACWLVSRSPPKSCSRC